MNYVPEGINEITLEWLYRELYRISDAINELTDMNNDPFLEIAKGSVSGVSHVNKFGRCPDNVDATGTTDIWDGAIAATGTQTWVAPTAARIHAIVSTSASDTSGGAGARTIQVYGLKDWDTAETSEVITLLGTTPVNTTNSYVIIHRIKVRTKGATNVNVGTITATAATDATITAQINPGEGQTQMAIYGIPSVQTAYLTKIYCSVNRAVAASIDARLYVNPEPDTELLNFLVKSTLAINSQGSTFLERAYAPYFKVTGPAIIKITATSSANNSDVSAGFDLILVRN